MREEWGVEPLRIREGGVRFIFTFISMLSFFPTVKRVHRGLTPPFSFLSPVHPVCAVLGKDVSMPRTSPAARPELGTRLVLVDVVVRCVETRSTTGPCPFTQRADLTRQSLAGQGRPRTILDERCGRVSACKKGVVARTPFPLYINCCINGIYIPSPLSGNTWTLIR